MYSWIGLFAMKQKIRYRSYPITFVKIWEGQNIKTIVTLVISKIIASTPAENAVKIRRDWCWWEENWKLAKILKANRKNATMPKFPNFARWPVGDALWSESYVIQKGSITFPSSHPSFALPSTSNVLDLFLRRMLDNAIGIGFQPLRACKVRTRWRRDWKLMC